MDWLGIGLTGAEIAHNQLTTAQQFKRQKRLMDIQQQNQMALNKQGQEIQLDTWEKTNFPAQMAMLKQAGLNPGLMYAKGGSGGTTGGQSGGGAGGGTAQAASVVRFADIMAMQSQKAQIQLVEAQKAKTEAETRVIEQTGIKEAETRIEKLLADTGNQKAQQALTEADTQFRKIQTEQASKSMDELIEGIKLNNQKLATEIRKEVQEANISEATADEIIKQIQQRTIEQGLEMALIKENIIKTGEQTKEIQTHIRTMATEVVQRWTQLSIQEQHLAIEQMFAKFNTNLPSKIGQWTGIIGNLLSGAKGIMPSKGGGITINN